jgi:RNA polymerase sigma-70 factor (ECF subfamily)
VESEAELPAPEARSDLSDDLAEAIGRLAPDQRAVIVLRYLLEHTPGEIADMLDLPRGTVNSRLRRALDELAGAVES